jgi:hypothetical protein
VTGTACLSRFTGRYATIAPVEKEDRMSSVHALSAVLVALFVTACNHSDRDGGDRRAPSGRATRPASTEPTEFTGTLRGGAVAIGGETTGWRLEGDGATGGLDLDVSRVRQQAQSLQGRRVTVSGKTATRDWPERGPTQVLVVERMTEAPHKEVPGVH